MSRKIESSDIRRATRVPPGQTRTKNGRWPVLHAGEVQHVATEQWELRAFGLVERERTWNFQQFAALPRAQVSSDFHCVTRWSRLDNLWEGVLARDVVGELTLDPGARAVMVHAYGGFTTNLLLEDFLGDDVIFAFSNEGQDLGPEHGGPVRLVVPRLYAWKSAKWVSALEFIAEDAPGFWERLGYHQRGDPWREERYASKRSWEE